MNNINVSFNTLLILDPSFRRIKIESNLPQGNMPLSDFFSLHDISVLCNECMQDGSDCQDIGDIANRVTSKISLEIFSIIGEMPDLQVGDGLWELLEDVVMTLADVETSLMASLEIKTWTGSYNAICKVTGRW